MKRKKQRVKKILNKSIFSKLGRLIFKSVLCGFVICMAVSMTAFDAQSKEISNKVVRLHILANSDSKEDQDLKLCVRDTVRDYCRGIYDDVKTKEEAEQILHQKLPEIISAAQKEVYRQGYNYPVKGEFVNMYFTNRVYNNITMPAGDYDAVRITIGSGNGHNWWCVMFPPICIGAAEAGSENQTELSDVLNDNQINIIQNKKYEYKFKIYEIYQNLIKKSDKEVIE